MVKVTVGKEGCVRLPESYRERYGLDKWSGFIVEPTEDGFALRQARPDAHRAYIEVTAYCNLNCATCVRQVWLDESGSMSWDTFTAIIEQLEAFPDLRQITFGGFGEPLMHPHIVEMVRRAGELGVKTTITTNGLLLDRAMTGQLLEAHLDTVVISLDTIHAQAYRKASLEQGLDRVLDNVRAFRALAAERGLLVPRIGLEFVATKSALEELATLPGLARELGASFVLVSNLLPHRPEMIEELLYDSDQPLPISIGWHIPRADWLLWGIIKLPRMKWGALRRCRFIEGHSFAIGWDGSVSPCYALMHSYTCYIYGEPKEMSRYILGNVVKMPLVEIWTSEEYVRFRAKVREFRFPSCVDCGLIGCSYRQANNDCWGNVPSCADCLWAQDIVRCP